MNDTAGTPPDHGDADRVDDTETLTLRTAREALAHEAAMIGALVDRIGASFVRAVELIRSCNGRVAVTGLGKSGHVGRKIAATFASTGTPAFFVHAAEAHHGDAGMLLPGDVLVAISNSGETHEVVEFARMSHARGIAVIAFSGSRDSSLAREADEFVDIGVEREADPLDLTPTASTTTTMAMGDALCIALMGLREFLPDAFLQTHPAGALGARASSRSVETVRPTLPSEEAPQQPPLGSAPVEEGEGDG